MKQILLVFFITMSFLSNQGSAWAQASAHPRTIVTTDGEVDDMDSFIRLLLYANDLNLVGLVYSSSEFHYAGDGKGTTFTSNMPWAKGYGTRTDLRWLGTTWMQEYIDKYALYYNNLITHDKNYPSPAYLKSLIKIGNIDFEGEMEKDTEGSNFIKGILMDSNPQPVYIQMWGGTNTVARALKSIEDQYKDTPEWKDIYKRVSDKAYLYIILDQDETYGKYISVHWPNVSIIYNSRQFWCLAYPWNKMVPKATQPYLSGKWFAENIKFNHGELLGSYFLWGDGQRLEEDPDHVHGDTAEARKNGMQQFDFISEGDSPSYLYLLDVGLRSIEDPAYGGWGGRFVKSDTKPRFWTDGETIKDYNLLDHKEDDQFPQTRWVDVMQNDFAARADWCVKSYAEANHAPVVALHGKNNVSQKINTKVTLKSSAKDPDANKMTYKWWHYKEAGTFSGTIRIENQDKPDAAFVIPSTAKSGDTIHMILEVSDDGIPSLTRYQRLIVTVR